MSNQEVAYMNDRIEKQIDLKAPVERVWHALTDHEAFGEWFRVKLDGPFVKGEVSSGHITWPGYEHLRWEAKIERMDAPRMFAFTWHPAAIDTSVDYSKETPTLVEFRLEPIEGGTRLTVVESGFSGLPKHRLGDAMRMNDEGWTVQMENIRHYVES
jgi:uncharacterized protein YndB with AHSA1/START domain